MKSLLEYITESSNNSEISNEIIKAYFDEIHDSLKESIVAALENTNKLVSDIAASLGKDNASIILNKSQLYETLIEGLLFKELSNKIEGFEYKLGKENTSDKDFICTSASTKNKELNKLSSEMFSIQLKTSKTSNKFTFNVSGTEQTSFYILIIYKKSGHNISLDKSYFAYLSKEDWNGKTLNIKNIDKNRLFEI